MFEPFSQLRQGRKRMTYIVGMRSAGERGFVISADSQETYNEEVDYVEKIETDDAGRWEVAIGGAGRGQLVDGFVQHAIETIRKADPKDSDPLGQTLRDALVQFYGTDVRLFPGREKSVKFLIGARHSDTGKTCLWRTAGSRVFPVQKATAIGYRAPFCNYILKRMYRSNLELPQLVLLSVYLLTIAKKS